MGLDLQTLARLGAEQRLAQLKEEQEAIWAAFPDLAPTVNGRPRPLVEAHMAKMRAARERRKK